ncbi:splicing factor U2af large subunit B isoform X2 [Populus trichocarpa]|uniref:splicing factor U2af large subunit B isoform X2 n=1 Tax=Populus trichocarpa TaxID=3694 RepID=UPI000D188019|nr:splicing factor U2af large subunit B isoform X2 [Populus trichocarpa]|eukprot:XP_024461340.1 splicing factor U2af large subunit B isoform X3 [Populus trichocarpa]
MKQKDTKVTAVPTSKTRATVPAALIPLLSLAALMITAILSLSVGLVTMRGSLQKVGKKREAKTGTEVEIGKEIETRIGRKVRTGIEIGTETRIVIVIVIAIEIALKGGIEVEIGMVMIITEAETMTAGRETMIETKKTGIDVGRDLVQRVDLSTDQGHALRAKGSVVLIWLLLLLQCCLVLLLLLLLLQCGKSVSNYMVSFGQITGTTPPIPGMFPNMFPLGTGQFGALPVMPVQAMTQQATRHARRVYVGGLPPIANEQSVATFFSQVMAAIGGNTAGPGDAVVNVYINHEKKFAFVEMRSVEEASNAMALDGIIFEGAPVKVRRPSDYNPSLAATLGPSQPNPNLNLAAVGLTPGSAGGLEGPDRIFVGGLPYYFTEAQIRELLESFGALRGFDLVKDRETGNSKGYAFCVYQDLSVTDIACAALNGIKMGDKTLTVRRANQGTNQPKPEQENVLLHAQQQIALQRLMLQPPPVVTKVVCLTQVVTVDELKDDDEYEDILEDIRMEAGKFGQLVNVVIPRPRPDGENAPGVGKVFLEYADTEGSSKARAGMNGRKFGGNHVVAVFFPENKFSQGEYDD